MIEALRVVLFDETGVPGATADAVLHALDACIHIERVYVVGAQRTPPTGEAMESIVFLRHRAARPFCRARRLAWLALRSEKVHLVICEHQSLLLPAWLIARLRGARLAAILTDNGSWRGPRSWIAPFLARGIDSFAVFDAASARQFSLWSGIPLDRSFQLQRPRQLQTPGSGEAGRAAREPNAFAADVTDWLWGV